MRKHSVAFTRIDTNDDDLIDYHEFLDAVPPHVREMRSPREIRRWFDMLDKNKTGCVSIDEFYKWSLGAASMSSGSGIMKTFARFDSDGDGHVTEREFCQAAYEMGYGHAAQKLYKAMPQQGGQIDYKRAISDLGNMSRTMDETKEMRDFLAAMAWDTVESFVDSAAIEGYGWKLVSKEPEAIREEVARLLQKDGVHLSDIFETLDTSDDYRISRDEFVLGFERLFAYQGPQEALVAIFVAMDVDKSGVVHLDELNGWVNGRHLRTERLLTEALLAPRVHAHEESWDVRRLQTEMVSMLTENGLCAADVFRAWDGDGNDSLTKREYLIGFKRLFGRLKEALWYSKVRWAVTETFKLVDAERSGAIQIDEIEKWLAAPTPRQGRSSHHSSCGSAPSPGAKPAASSTTVNDQTVNDAAGFTAGSTAKEAAGSSRQQAAGSIAATEATAQLQQLQALDEQMGGIMLWTPTKQAELAAFLPPRPSPPAAHRLCQPRRRHPARKLASLDLSAPPEPSELVPRVRPTARLLNETSGFSRKSMPQATPLEAVFTASTSKLRLPLEASVAWRSSRAPSWSPHSDREEQLLQSTLRERVRLLAAKRSFAASLPLVPRTSYREPVLNSSQYGLYREWPKGALLPLARSLDPLGKSWDEPPRGNVTRESTTGGSTGPFRAGIMLHSSRAETAGSLTAGSLRRSASVA